jgi:class 3 adenylate cyclase
MFPHSPSEVERILDAMLDHPERAAELAVQLHASCLRRKAILVLDMCAFSRITRERGVLAFLLMIRRMRRICEPCLVRHGGGLLRAEADNLFYYFDSPAEAVAGAREAMSELSRVNPTLPAGDHLFCAIGIGFGEVLCLSECNVHGYEVNLAFKLGEDVARAGQILLSEAAYAALGDAAPPVRAGVAAVSGLELRHFEILP